MLACGFSVELTGLEPVTPTLPGTGRPSDRARWAAKGRLGGVVGQQLSSDQGLRHAYTTGDSEAASWRGGEGLRPPAGAVGSERNASPRASTPTSVTANSTAVVATTGGAPACS